MGDFGRNYSVSGEVCELALQRLTAVKIVGVLGVDEEKKKDAELMMHSVETQGDYVKTED